MTAINEQELERQKKSIKSITALVKEQDRLRERILELEAEKAEREKPCRWVMARDRNQYKAACGGPRIYFDAILSRHCPDCGGPVEVVKGEQHD